MEVKEAEGLTESRKVAPWANFKIELKNIEKSEKVPKIMNLLGHEGVIFVQTLTNNEQG